MTADRPFDFMSELQRGLTLHERGDWDEAAHVYDRILDHEPHADVLHLRGLIHQHRGHPALALPYYQRALQFQPESDTLLANLGNTCLAAGEVLQAEQYFRQSLARNAANSNALKGLSQLLAARGAHAEAREVLEHWVAWQPDNGFAWHQLGVARERTGQTAEAEQAYRKAVQCQPDEAQYRNDLGSLLQRQGKHQRALEVLEELLRLHPRHPAGWSNLGISLRQLQRPDEAEAAMKRALACNPRFAVAAFNLGNLLHERGRTPEAIEFYRQAVSLRPRHADFRLNLAVALNSQGEFAEAAQICRNILADHPRHVLAYYTLFTFGAGQVTDEEAQRLGELLQDSHISRNDQVNAYFSLAKRCDQLEQFDQAMEYYHQANSLANRIGEFQYSRLCELVDRLIAAFTPELMQIWRNRGNASAQPIFILGMPRSGSTLVDQILTSHTQVGFAGEFEGMRRIVMGMLDIPFRSHPEATDEFAYPTSVTRLSQPLLDRMAQSYLELLRNKGGDFPRITDKMPNNFLHIGLIALLFPRSTIIYTRRHPLDICLSCYFQNFSIGHPFSYDLRATAQFYRQHERLMQHWLQLCPDRIHVVDYELLVEQQEGQTHRLIEEICGLPWEESCLKFHENPRPVTTASLWQVRQPLYRESVDRWKKYAAHLQPLFEELGLDPETGLPLSS